jgi:hypothetical protein
MLYGDRLGKLPEDRTGMRVTDRRTGQRQDPATRWRDDPGTDRFVELNRCCRLNRNDTVTTLSPASGRQQPPGGYRAMGLIDRSSERYLDAGIRADPAPWWRRRDDPYRVSKLPECRSMIDGSRSGVTAYSALKERYR